MNQWSTSRAMLVAYLLIASYLGLAEPAYAVRTSVTGSVITPKGPYPGTVAANALDAPSFDLDNTNGNVFVGTGRDLLVIQNPTGGAITVTLTSANDPHKRKGDITAYSLGAGEVMAFWYGSLIGWDQGSGQIYLDCSATGLKGWIFRIP